MSFAHGGRCFFLICNHVICSGEVFKEQSAVRTLSLDAPEKRLVHAEKTMADLEDLCSVNFRKNAAEKGFVQIVKRKPDKNRIKTKPHLKACIHGGAYCLEARIKSRRIFFVFPDYRFRRNGKGQNQRIDRIVMFEESKVCALGTDFYGKVFLRGEERIEFPEIRKDGIKCHEVRVIRGRQKSIPIRHSLQLAGYGLLKILDIYKCHEVRRGVHTLQIAVIAGERAAEQEGCVKEMVCAEILADVGPRIKEWLFLDGEDEGLVFLLPPDILVRTVEYILVMAHGDDRTVRIFFQNDPGHIIGLCLILNIYRAKRRAFGARS